MSQLFLISSSFPILFLWHESTFNYFHSLGMLFQEYHVRFFSLLHLLFFLSLFCGFSASKKLLKGQSFKSDDSVVSHVSFSGLGPVGMWSCRQG